MSAFDEASEEFVAEELERELIEEFKREEEAARRKPRLAYAFRPAIAASIAVLAAGAAFLAVNYQAEDGKAYATAIGEQINVALDDGSTATLNTNSKLKVDYSADKRVVKVKLGEALFEVARDLERPFIVRTPLATIKVTGTTFDVRTSPDETMVLVVTGSVSVAPKGQRARMLEAGQLIHIDKSGAGDIIPIDAARVLSWRAGKARYQDKPLGQVVSDLNRYFATPIALADARFAGMPVTGEFDLRDQNTAVAALAAAFDLQVRRDPERIVLFQ
ncbi:MAG: FecR domain-containing protein [Parvularculaceae bacterium]